MVEGGEKTVGQNNSVGAEIRDKDTLSISVTETEVADILTKFLTKNGEPSKLCHLTIKDNSDECKMILWGDLATRDLSKGDTVEVTNVRITMYDGIT